MESAALLNVTGIAISGPDGIMPGERGCIPTPLTHAVNVALVRAARLECFGLGGDLEQTVDQIIELRRTLNRIGRDIS